MLKLRGGKFPWELAEINEVKLRLLTALEKKIVKLLSEALGNDRDLNADLS